MPRTTPEVRDALAALAEASTDKARRDLERQLVEPTDDPGPHRDEPDAEVAP